VRRAAIRSLVRRGSRSDHSPPVARRNTFHDPTACAQCGAIFFHKTWRQHRGHLSRLLRRAVWGICPACLQVAHGEFYGRVVISSPALQEPEILRRVENVAARAGFTQPERRIVRVLHTVGGLEVQTTSQKLAHRIARELEKAFGGHSRFAWSDSDGRLFVCWEPRPPLARRGAKRSRRG
jgi:hypothetical protein